jgi:hypothetical protein
MGIFIASNEEIGGFDWNPSQEVISNASPDGDDQTYYEIRKFFRLATKSSQVLLPFIISDTVIGSTSFGHEVIEVARKDLISVKGLLGSANYIRGKHLVFASKGTEKDSIESFYIGELVLRYFKYGLSWGSLPMTEGDSISGLTYPEFMSLEPLKRGEYIQGVATRIEELVPNPRLRNEPDLTRATKFLAHVRNHPFA